MRQTLSNIFENSLYNQILSFILTFLAAGMIQASDTWTVLSSGGGYAIGTGLGMEFSVGQPIAGQFGSDVMLVNGGFIQSFGPSTCCIGQTGDFDGSGSDVPDIADLVGFVEWLFAAGAPPVCYAEANINGDPGGIADISDIVKLVDFMFFSGAAPAACR
ncbi:MAG TPA: hypothetical protein PLF13_01285 [candidate division Zixibacteria bacterium]|nr:hypothetical protein [candidate division Zixibacteria bacterium]